MTDNTETFRFLDEHGIKYERDGKRIVVPGNLDIDNLGLTALPDLTNVTVEGSFRCHDNQLTSLKGAPRAVGKHFACARNQLISLEGAPASVPGIFDCSQNQLKSLQHSPKTIGEDFQCEHNELTSLRFGPKTVLGNYYCFSNPLTDIPRRPQRLDGCLYYDDEIDLRFLDANKKSKSR